MATSGSTALQLQFACPFSGAGAFRTDGFLGAWSPYRPLHVTAFRDDSSRAAYLRGPNWFLCSAIAHVPSGDRPKIHADRQNDRALAFRGYIVNPPLHHLSAPNELWRYWGTSGGRYSNGVFAMALIEGGDRLVLKTDAFGFSPLYYRAAGDFVLFGTKPDFLVTDQAELDPVGTAAVLAHNYPLGDRTLLRGIRRCPFGAALRFEGNTEAKRDWWFGAEELPEPDQPLDDARAAQSEQAFREAVRRCTALGYGPSHVPLTSGYDSRRIVGALLEERQPFTSTTVRVYRDGGRDLDARYASELAQRFGFDHRIVDLPPAKVYAEDNEYRRRELCAETRMHDGWVSSLTRALPAEPTLLLDGFLGDVLGRPGFRLENPDFYKNPHADIERIADAIARTPLRRYVTEAFHSGDRARDELRHYLEPLAAKRNVAELAFILLRQRRGTSLWAQQLFAPEHLVVSPYADLDFMSTVMAIRPQDRFGSDLQRVCLERFYPSLAAVPGSHAIPPEAVPVGIEGDRQRSLAWIRRMTAGLDPVRDRALLRERLTPIGQALIGASWLAPARTRRRHWAVRPILEALLHDRLAPPVWRTGAEGMRPHE